MATDDQQSNQHELWGLEAFFKEVSAFLHEASRQFGNCTEEYASYEVFSESKSILHAYIAGFFSESNSIPHS